MKKRQDHSSVYRKTETILAPRPLRATTFWTSLSNSHCFVLEAGNDQTHCRKFDSGEGRTRSLGVVSPTLIKCFLSSCRCCLVLRCFLFPSLSSFYLYSYTSLISVSTKRETMTWKEGGKQLKKKHTLTNVIAHSRTPWNINEIFINERNVEVVKRSSCSWRSSQ